MVKKLDKYVAYASGFVSFLLKEKDLKKSEVKEIILFGSVVREEADSKSDVDIFIDTVNEKKVELVVKEALQRFYRSRIYEDWKLRGVKNEIKVQVGMLDSWGLKRSVISNGIVLYGGYKALPKKGEHYQLFTFEPIRDITIRNRVARALFGRKEKGYFQKGLVEEVGGKILNQRCFYVPVRSSDQVVRLLSREKIDYKLFELWSDVL